VLFFALGSLIAFYPVCFVLYQKHKNKGFEVTFIVNIVICNCFEKLCIAFDMKQLFVSADSWHKLCNICMLTQFLCLMIYLARIPEKYKGLTLGVGMALIIVF